MYRQDNTKQLTTIPSFYNYWWNYSGGYSAPPYPAGYTPTGTIPGQFSRHNGGANCLFVDGHAKWYPEAELRDDQDDMFGFSNF